MVRIEDTNQKADLFSMKGIQSVGFTLGAAPCANVVCEDRKDVCFVESDSSILADLLSSKPECHHPSKSNCSLLLSSTDILLIA